METEIKTVTVTKKEKAPKKMIYCGACEKSYSICHLQQHYQTNKHKKNLSAIDNENTNTTTDSSDETKQSLSIPLHKGIKITITY